MSIMSYSMKTFQRNLKVYRLILSNAVFGFAKFSNFMKYVMDLIQTQTFQLSQEDPTTATGPTIFTTAFLNYNDSNILLIPQRYLIGPEFTNDSITIHFNDANWVSAE